VTFKKASVAHANEKEFPAFRHGENVKSYYQDNHTKIFNKDCRSMSELPDESVQMVVTSPP